MSTIVTRAGKGSALTHTEVDANFTNLNTDKLQSGDTATALTITTATVGAGTVSAPSLTTAGDTNTGIYFPAADTIAFTEGGVESMRINSSGNVGIGTSSPAEKFEVYGTNPAISIYSDSTSGRSDLFFKDSGGASGRLRYDHASDYLATFTNGAERMRLDASGNLGLGVTPSASTVPTLQFANQVTLSSGGNSASFAQNAIRDTSWKYITTAAATLYQHGAGAHFWYTAPSGTAGNAITFTQAMKLDASGKLALGTTSSVDHLTLVNPSDTNQFIGFDWIDSSTARIRSTRLSTGANQSLRLDGQDNVLLFTNGSERARITSAGNVGVGTTSPQDVVDLGSGTSGRALTWGGAAGTVRTNSIFSAYSSGALVLGASFHGSDSTDTYINSYTGTNAASGIRLNRSGTTGIQFFTDAAAAKTAGNAFTPTERMRIDSAGNLGLGVTPSAWKTNEYKAVQVGIGASFYGRVTAGDEDKAGFSANSFYDQTDNRWEYIATDSASRYDQTGGGHYWYTAPSGTANAAITFTQAMTLDASGNLGIGTTSPVGRLDVSGSNAGSVLSSRILNTSTSASSDAQQFIYVNSGTAGDPYTTWTVGGVTSWSGGIRNSDSDNWYLSPGSSLGTSPVLVATTSGFTQFPSNLVMPYQGAPTSKSTTATLTGAELITGILNTTGTTYTITLPTGTNIEGALTWSANNVSLDFFVINTASGTITIGANGNTTLGSLTIATGTSAQFRIRRTAANTFTVYRLG